MEIRVQGLEKTYRAADGKVLKGIDYTFAQGDFVALMGRSGSGKSTLLNIMAGITQPTAGKVFYEDQDLFALSDVRRSEQRAQKTATIFQDYNLLDFLTARENIALGSTISGAKTSPEDVERVLQQVDLGGFGEKYPRELSGGQCQRVAIARALAVQPSVIFADEPTGALDEKNSSAIVQLLRQAADRGVTVIMVTHDPYIAAAADGVLVLGDGKIVAEIPEPTPRKILAGMEMSGE